MCPSNCTSAATLTDMCSKSPSPISDNQRRLAETPDTAKSCPIRSTSPLAGCPREIRVVLSVCPRAWFDRNTVHRQSLNKILLIGLASSKRWLKVIPNKAVYPIHLAFEESLRESRAPNGRFNARKDDPRSAAHSHARGIRSRRADRRYALAAPVG